ncbi:MAG TPA: sodium:proton antiporter, partial [Treponema sp.]|nr:sodium:proton antiporter [Treponema sp.]
MTDSLGASEYVGGVVARIAANGAVMSLIPALVFLVGIFLAFATGTSWGTFGILIPIVVNLFGGDVNNELMIIAISACMAGAVCGDHCSPISDTTIMASAGAGCEHIRHVSTQLPYVITVATVSLVSYIIAGFVRNWAICLLIAVVLMILTLVVIKKVTVGKRNEASESLAS